MDNKRDIFVSISSQIAVRLIGLVVSLVSVKLLASAYGSSGTGIYNTITTYLTFCVVLADMGLFSVAVREIAKDPERERAVVANILSIRLVASSLAAFVAVMAIAFTGYSPEMIRGTQIAAIFIFFNLLASSFDIVFQYRLKMQLSALSELIAKLATLAVLWLAIRSHAGFLWAVASIPVSGLTLLICKAFFSRKLLAVWPKWDPKLVGWIVRLSLPLGAVYVINNLYFKIDTLVLFALKGAVAVGVYSVSYKVLEVTGFMGAYFASSLKPALARNAHDAGRLVNRSLIVMLIISLPIAAASAVFAKPIILFLSNSEFLGGVRALEVLAWSLPLIYCDVLLSEVLIARDARRQLLLVAGGSLTCNLCLDFLLIPRYSYDGAAVATLISEAALLGANLICCRPLVRLNLPWQTVFKLLASTFVLVFVGELTLRLPANFLIGIGLSLCAYAGSLLLLKAVSVAELKNLFRQTA